jgi:predicted SprT family Zn-dependent metalloprotease
MIVVVAMNITQAEKLATHLMQQHGLDGWHFKWDRATKRLGCCNYTKKRITLSAHQTKNRQEVEVKDTILHEIAHALLPPRTGHGKLWKAKCVEIGAKPQRCVIIGRNNTGPARKFFVALKGIFAAE